MPTAPIDHFRKLCLALPDASEGTHHGSIAFKAGKQMFATFRDDDGPQIVLQLESAHASAVVKNDARFKPYPRLKDVVILDASQVEDWKEVAALVRESYELATKKPAKPAKPRAKRA